MEVTNQSEAPPYVICKKLGVNWPYQIGRRKGETAIPNEGGRRIISKDIWAKRRDRSMQENTRKKKESGKQDCGVTLKPRSQAKKGLIGDCWWEYCRAEVTC